MRCGERTERGAALDVLRGVLVAIALLGALLSSAGAWSGLAPDERRADTRGRSALAHEAASDLLGLVLDRSAPDGVRASPGEVSEQDLEGCKGEGSDSKPPKDRSVVVPGSTTAVALAAPVDHTPDFSRRLIASPSRAPPVG